MASQDGPFDCSCIDGNGRALAAATATILAFPAVLSMLVPAWTAERFVLLAACWVIAGCLVASLLDRVRFGWTHRGDADPPAVPSLGGVALVPEPVMAQRPTIA